VNELTVDAGAAHGDYVSFIRIAATSILRTQLSGVLAFINS